MKLAQVEASLDVYDAYFRNFVEEYQLPKKLFVRPDHFAIKCADELDYLDTCDALSGIAGDDGMWEFRQEEYGRSLASAQLSGRVAMSGLEFGWVEVMQPKVGKEAEAGLVEHTEFYFPDFFAVEQVLQQRGIDYDLQHNDGHSWVNVVMDEQGGREIKLNNKPLAEVILWERKQGLLHRIGL